MSRLYFTTMKSRPTPTENIRSFADPTHWGRVTHICVGKLTIIGLDNGLSPGRRQAIIQTNAEILLIGPLGTNFSEIVSEIQTFSFKKMHLILSSAKWRPFCLGLNVLGDVTAFLARPLCHIINRFNSSMLSGISTKFTDPSSPTQDASPPLPDLPTPLQDQQDLSDFKGGGRSAFMAAKCGRGLFDRTASICIQRPLGISEVLCIGWR